MLNIHVPISIVFIVFSVVGIAFLVPVPMGLGSLEVFQASLFSILGLGSAAGVGLAMITRARDLLWVLVGVIFSLYIGAFKRVVREALVQKQREMGRGGGVVLEGRDIGTVVFPGADVKFYLDARTEERARRRFQELIEIWTAPGGIDCHYVDVMIDLFINEKGIITGILRCPVSPSSIGWHLLFGNCMQHLTILMKSLWGCRHTARKSLMC
jgi:hypothetical protein